MTLQNRNGRSDFKCYKNFMSHTDKPENNIAEIKHVVKNEFDEHLDLNLFQDNSKVKNAIKFNTRENYKTKKTVHKMGHCNKLNTNIAASLPYYSKNKTYQKTVKQTYCSISSVCSYKTKESSIKLYYYNKSKDSNKAIFYKDICITGDKIALWRKLKRKFSSLTSPFDKLKVNTTTSLTNNNDHINFKKHRENSINEKKENEVLFPKGWEYCMGDDVENKNCNLHQLQFPDLPVPSHRFYKKCGCRKNKSEQKFNLIKLDDADSIKSCITLKNVKTKSESVVESNASKINNACGETNILTCSKEIGCDINITTCDTCTDMNEIILLESNSTQCLDQEIETKCDEKVTVDCSTQDDVQMENGDQIQKSQKYSLLSKCLEKKLVSIVKKNTHCLCKQGIIILKKLNKTNSKICTPKIKCCTQKTQTCMKDKIKTRSKIDGREIFPHKLKRNVGIQCWTKTQSKYQNNNTKKCDRTKKISTKLVISNKASMYKLPLKKASTKGIQCCQKSQRISTLPKNNKLLKLRKKLSRFRITTNTKENSPVDISLSCKCMKKNKIVNKSSEKYTSCKKAITPAVGTQSPCTKKHFKDNKSSTKDNKKCRKQKTSTKISQRHNTSTTPKKCKNSKNNTLCWQKCSKKQICKPCSNSIETQCSALKPKSCAKNLHVSTSCKNIGCRVQPIPCSSVGTQYHKKCPQGIRLHMKRDWSLFNFKKRTPHQRCKCVQSLMLIDKSYRDYWVNPALLTRNKCQQCNQLHENNCPYCYHDRGDFDSTKRHTLITKLKKKSANSCTQCKPIQCEKCSRKDRCISEYCKKYPGYSCSSFCAMSPNYPCKGVPCKHAKPCKNRNKGKKRCSSSYHHCKNSFICRMYGHLRKLIRLFIFTDESCGVKRKCCKKAKVRHSSYTNISYNHIFMNTVRKPRYVMIYRMCPWAYPECLKCLNIWKQNFQVILLIFSWILWCPIMILIASFRLCCCVFCCK